MAGAQGAVDSLLGRLTSVLLDEAQLLGRIRSDVEFIKEEMECMNSLILHLTEAQYRDHLVRAWMKQVVGLTRDCEGNVAHYIHYIGSRPGDDGLLGYLRQIVRFLRTIPVRHRIAMRIRELKVRARDVADRRQRYGVTVPASTRAYMNVVDIEPSGWEEDLRRRAVLLHGAEHPANDEEEVVVRGMNTLVKCLSMEPAITEDGAPLQPQVRVISILGRTLVSEVVPSKKTLVDDVVQPKKTLVDEVAKRVYQQHSSVATKFGRKAWLEDGKAFGTVLTEILKQVGGVQLQSSQAEATVVEEKDMVKRLISKIQGRLKGERFLIVVTTHKLVQREWKRILAALLQAADGSLPGSAIVMTTRDSDMVLLSSPYKIINVSCPPNAYEFYNNEATKLGAKSSYHEFFRPFNSDSFAMKKFLHLLYVNPNRTEDELQNYKNAISECRRLNRSISKQVLMWCYNELPSKYRTCLLYLTIFPEGHIIRTTSLARRWVSEGLITATTTSSAIDEIRSSTDEAEHYLDVLFIGGFVSPKEISAAGNIKSCTVHHEVREFINRVATDVNLMDSNLPPHLARYLSIQNRLGFQKSHSDGDSKDIATYLPSLAASPQWQLLKVLDLEGCKGLDKKHMKSICKVLLLKYLSLRNTDVAELPKQMKELQCLETLDIRQTKVQVFGKKAIVLPLLKHFLAGDNMSVSNDARKSEESFSAVDMPPGIHRMKNMEILSHVQVTNSTSELTGIAELLKLRKLGVALRGTSAKLGDLFRQIDKLHKCLRSLSIRIHQQAVGEKHDALTPPNFIRSLNISGLTSGLPHMIQELHQLVKLTLTETSLNEDGLCILGKLRGLRILRLLHKSYIQSELSFKKEEFQTLNFLLVGTTNVTNINFADGAAPKLERIIWSFPTTASVSGLRHLPKLREFELNGDCNPDQVRDDIERHIEFPVFKHNNPHPQRQEERAAASASSSSAP